MNLDSTIFIVFLVINIAMGLFYSRGVKNISQYAIGDGNFSTAAITAAIVATWISGGIFSLTITETYKQGLYFIIPLIGDALVFVIIGYFLAPRMGQFLGSLSVAKSMGQLYGKNARLITAVVGIFGCAGEVAMQFKVCSTILQMFFGISSFYAVIFSSLVVVLYSALGGIKAITFTDMIQFFTFGTIIPVLSLIIWGTLSDPYKVFSTISEHPLFDYQQVFDFSNPRFFPTLTLFLFFALPNMYPVIFQRIAMAKNTLQVSKSFLFAALICLFIELTIAFVGVLLLSEKPDLDPNNVFAYIIDTYTYTGLKGIVAVGIISMIMSTTDSYINSEKPDLDPNNVFAYIIDTYTYTGLKGIVAVGIISMIMSTTDSYINSAAVMFSHDFYAPLGLGKVKNELLVSRIFSVLIGILAFALAFNTGSLLELGLMVWSFYIPIVTVPLLLSIFGFRSTNLSFLIGSAGGLATVVIWRMYLLDTGVDSVIPGMLASLLFLLSGHYILRQPGGWLGIEDDSVLKIIRAERARKWKQFLTQIKKFNFLIFCKNNSPKQESTYSLFGFFCIISVFSTMYSLPYGIRQQHAELIQFIYHTVLISSTMFLTYPIWPPTFKKQNFIIMTWNFIVPYILVFAPTLLVIISNFAQLQLMIFLINLIMISLIFRWQVALLMIFLGVFLSFKIFPYLSYANNVKVVDISLQFKIMYSLLLFSSILIAFLKPKQDRADFVEEKAEHLASTMEYKDEELQKALNLKSEFIRNVTHEYHAPMTGVISTLDGLIAAYDVLDDDKIKQIMQNIYQSAVKVESFDDNIRDLARLSSNEAELDIQQVNLSELVITRLNACTKIYLEQNRQLDYVFTTNIENEIVAEVDEYYLTQTLDNLIINAFTYSKYGTIKLELKKKNSNIVEFNITDEGIGIPKDELYDIFGSFTVSSRTRTPAGGRGVGLALCKRVIEMHNGTIKAESSKEQTTFTFSLPIKLNDLAESISEEMIGVAKKLLKDGINIKSIAKATGMKETQIKAMQK